MSNQTKKCRRAYWILTILSFILVMGPLLYYVGAAYLAGSIVVTKKLALSATLILTIILWAIGTIQKIAYRSKIFLVLLGLYFCLDSIIMPLVIISICQITDEIIITPARKRTKIRLITNKELDKRDIT